MTLYELQAMSNAELNELAAVKVMGWETNQLFGWGIVVVDPLIPEKSKHKWNPTEDMNDAMVLAENIIAMGADFDLIYHDYHQKQGYIGWSARFLRGSEFPNSHRNIVSVSAARAITIAAILAKASE